MRLKDGSLSSGKKVLIDGQQRVTALSAALAGQQVVNKEYKSVHVRIAFNPKDERFEVANPAIQKDKAWIADISPIMQEEVSLLKLIRNYTQANPDVDEDQMERVLTQLRGITKKQIGMIELAAELDIEAVTEIFIRINREGVPLSQADFAMSKIAANETHGGNQLRKAIDYFCHLAVAPEFYSHIQNNDTDFSSSDYFQAMKWLRNENDDLYDPSYSDMLRVAFISRFSRGKLADLVALLSGRDFETRTYEESIAEASFENLKAGVFSFMSENNFKRFLMILKSAGFVVSGLLKNRQGVINFTYALFLKLRADGVSGEKIETYIRRWFVLSVLTGRYSGSPETRMDQDIRRFDDDFGAYLESMEEAELSDAFWNVRLPQDLTTSNRNNPAFITFLAAQSKSNVRGFLSKDITVRSMLEHRGDIHHIFPRNFLKKQGYTQAKYNQVANFAYTQQEINIAIGDAPPEEYIGDIRAQVSGMGAKYGGISQLEEMKANFGENAVPVEFFEGSLFTYEDFLQARRKMMALMIRDYYQTL